MKRQAYVDAVFVEIHRRKRLDDVVRNRIRTFSVRMPEVDPDLILEGEARAFTETVSFTFGKNRKCPGRVNQRVITSALGRQFAPETFFFRKPPIHFRESQSETSLRVRFPLFVIAVRVEGEAISAAARL